ncbi:hypothetical protein [Scytonema sp. NUACC26]|uniref:hypothetical protein n=1 Tax=Scytonema sp. NUACC26 TaxID=3140176 RepID=UPI0034DC227B
MTEYFLSGNEETLKPIITMLVSIHQMIEDKDIGQFLGEPIEDHARVTPHTLKLTLIYYSVNEPPWKSDKPGKKLIKATYNIPDVDKRKMNWKNIKETAGGKNGYMWGRFVCTISLSNGRQIQAYGATEKEAEEQARAFLTLSKAKLAGISISDQKNEGAKAKGTGLYKEPTRIYPAFFSIINSQRILHEQNKALKREKSTRRRSKLSGNYIEYGSGRIPLWVSKEPSVAKVMIQRALQPISNDD